MTVTAPARPDRPQGLHAALRAAVALAVVLTVITVGLAGLFATAGSARTLRQPETRGAASTAAGGQIVGAHEPVVAGQRRARAPTYDQLAVGSCVAAETEPAVVDQAAAGDGVSDPAARRVTLREGTKADIQAAAPKTAGGDFIDPNTGQVIPKEGPFDYGHQPGYEWWRTQEMARAGGWTRGDVINFENDPSHYQIEDPSSNRSHLYEMP